MKQHGFTLIEMIVVVAIFGILIAAGVASYNRMNDGAQVEEAARILMTELRSLQKDVNSGRSSCTGTNSFQFITISDAGNDDRPLHYVDNCTGSGDLPEKPLKGKVEVNLNQTFDILNLNKGITPTNPPTTITVTNPAHTITYTITVSPSGGISVRKN